MGGRMQLHGLGWMLRPVSEQGLLAVQRVASWGSPRPTLRPWLFPATPPRPLHRLNMLYFCEVWKWPSRIHTHTHTPAISVPIFAIPAPRVPRIRWYGKYGMSAATAAAIWEGTGSRTVCPPQYDVLVYCDTVVDARPVLERLVAAGGAVGGASGSGSGGGGGCDKPIVLQVRVGVWA